MAFHVRDPEADALVREVARRRQIGLTEAVKHGMQALLDRDEAEVQARIARMRAIRQELATVPRTGLEADKAFYDSLNDE